MEKVQRRSNQDQAAQKQIRVIDGVRESKAKYRKVVQAGIALWVKEFRAGNIVMKTVDDLDKLIRMDLRLQRDE